MPARTIIPVLLLLLAGCVQAEKRSTGRQPYEIEKDKHVTVFLDGDVKAWGQRRIRRELSKETILEAAQGFAGLSMIKPKTITLKRGTESYKIPFDDMAKGRWKDFLLQDGDSISVNRIIF
jgi:membrane-bound lytic murein transglycosylase B